MNIILNLLQYLIVSWFLIISYLIFKTIIRPYLLVQYYKNLYGDKVATKYFPVKGRWRDAVPKPGSKDVGQALHLNYLKGEKGKNVKMLVSNNTTGVCFTVVNPDLIKELLINNFNNLEKQKNSFLLKDILFQDGIIFVDSEKWKLQRSILAPLFTFQELECRIPLILSLGKDLVNQLENKEIVKNLRIHLQRTTGNIAIASFFGKEFSNKTLNGKIITDEVASVLQGSIRYTIKSVLTTIRVGILGHNRYSKTPYFLYTKTEKAYIKRALDIYDLVKEEIQQRLHKFKKQSGDEEKHDLMSHLIQNLSEKKLTEKEVVHLFISLFFAGMDTTAHLAHIALYYLSVQREEQEILRKEINENIKSEADITNNNLQKLQNLSKFIQEVLRIRTPVLGIIPRTATKNLKLGEFIIPKGAEVAINIMGNHYNEQVFENPEKFNMNREHPKNSFSSIPFSAGQRNCIGQHMALLEVKIILILILQKYRLVRNEDVEFNMIWSFLYTSKYDNMVKYERL